MASSADLAVVLMQQQGSAHVFLVGKRATTLCTKINGSTSSSNSDKFFENVFRAFVKHVDFSTIRCVVIGSPGVKDEFRGYLLSEAQRLKLKSIEDKKSRIVVATTSPSNTHNLSEVLNDNAVINLIRETNVVPEIRVFKEFLDVVTSNSDHACYGPKSVETAHEMLAIETLLITDDLSGALRLRRGELTKLTGIAAMLRFPLPDLDEMVK
ncbi:protein PELOTA 1 [Quercus suber]|uniref:Protein pelota 1 n=1 Tax=Quercus suber TaxID=58331 RepID=A0AAW0M1L5_QUESU